MVTPGRGARFSSASSTPTLSTPLRTRDLSRNPILSLPGSRPSSAGLRPASPSREAGLLRLTPTTGDVRALEQVVALSLGSMGDTLRVHGEQLRALEARTRAAAAAEARVFELSAEVLVKADISDLESLAHRTEVLVDGAKEVLREQTTAAARLLSRETTSTLEELARRAGEAEARLAESERTRMAADAEARRLWLALERLEAKCAASEVACVSVRADLEAVRASKVERTELAIATASSADEWQIALIRHSTAVETATNGLATAAEVASCVKVVDFALALDRSREDARAATEEGGRRAASLEATVAEAARRADALERRVGMQREDEARRAREAAEKVATDGAAALQRAEVVWATQSAWQATELRAELAARTDGLERDAASLASREDLAAALRQLRAGLALKADASATADALRDCAPASLAAALAETAAVARAADSNLRAFTAPGSALELRILSLEHEMHLKCGLEDAHALVDARPDFAQMNEALGAVDSAIAASASATELAHHQLVLEVDQLAATATSENAVSRWVWDSGRAAGPDQRVLWDAQPTNLLPGNAWSMGSPEVQVAAAGLYRIRFGLFAAVSCAAQLLVNDFVVAEARSPALSHAADEVALAADGVAGGQPPLAASSEAASQDKATGRSASAKRRSRRGQATITAAERAPAASAELSALAARLSAPVRDGPRVTGPTCETLVCLLPNSRISLALGPSVPASLVNGFLEVRKIFS
ncbi:hypothetical protein T492DRAFT_1146228 [Pavlovales sp. CCMP2436]|nr:hypothetical protein T492DRAFT_1146228 [Pavlovales sp. CCMP2436]